MTFCLWFVVEVAKVTIITLNYAITVYIHVYVDLMYKSIAILRQKIALL